MANPEYSRILKKGVETWNEWRGRLRDPYYPLDLSMENLSHANLFRANLWQANLHLADLSHACLSDADLSLADLSGANLEAANLEGANLEGADLTKATLVEASLTQADLNYANLGDANLKSANLGLANLHKNKLSRANLHGAVFVETAIRDLDLSCAAGLENSIHWGPSTIGVDTLVKTAQGLSRDTGRQEEVLIFLREAGVQDQFLDLLRSMIEQRIKFYSCFISHSSKDKDFAKRLRADLLAHGVRCWFFSQDAKWGGSVWGEINKGIQDFDRLLVICSRASLKSGPVNREIERALQKEDREGALVLFPIRLAGFLFDEWEHDRKPDVLAKVVGDFTDWKSPNAYKTAFERLLRALKSE